MTNSQAPQPAPSLLHKLRAHIVWLAFGEARSPGWDGPPPTAREAVDAIDAALATQAPEGAPAEDYVLALLVAAGHITQSKVDEAREIAAKVAPEPHGDERAVFEAWYEGKPAQHMPACWNAWVARAALAAPAPQAPAWQPIETLPDDTLAILYGAKRSEMVIGMRHSRDGWVIDTPSEWASMYPPKLWMPLPAAPQTKEPTNDR